MRYRKDFDERYQYIMRGQTAALEAFVRNETEFAEFLLEQEKKSLCALDTLTYRGAVYFLNKEYRVKSGSLVLLLNMKEKIDDELYTTTKENFVDVLRYRFRLYGIALQEGGYS